MQRLKLALVLALMLVVGLQSTAQPTDFRAWVYLRDTGEMIEAGPGGETWRRLLPLPGGFDQSPFGNVAVSPDGNLYAYMASNSITFKQTLVIYNRASNSILATYGPDGLAYNSLDLGVRGAFSPDGRKFAFGYGFEDGGWELIVIDMAGFSLIGQLRSSDHPELADGFGMTPMPAAFTDSAEVAFRLVLGGADGAQRYDSYVWNVNTGEVVPTTVFGTPDLDVFLPTGEILFADADERLPMATDDRFFFGQNNAIFWVDPETRTSTPFIHSATQTFYQPRFVANGQMVLVGAYDGTNSTWLLYDRPGNLLAEYPIPEVVSTAATNRGFLMLGRFRSAPALYNIDLMAGGAIPSEPVWALGSETIPFLADVGGAAPYFFDMGTYQAWGALAPGIADSSPVTAPQPDETVLRIGGQATIRTTAGDDLNMRSGAGTGFNVVTQVRPGTVVTLLDGPVDSNNYTWWRVRTPSGQEGWVVDFADNEETLLPGAVVVDTTPPTAIPGNVDSSVGSQLAVGDTATVLLSRSNDTLRLRAEPSVGQILKLMPSYTIVTVIGGPVQRDGYTWWQLRTSDNVVGYAAEIIGPERVLVRGALIAPLVAPTPSIGIVVPIIVPVTTPEIRAP
jgi:hypothetical protein